GEKEARGRVLAKATLELQANERMQLGVLVDWAIDAHEQAPRLEQREMLLEVLRRCVRRSLVGDVEHCGASCARGRQGTTCGDVGAMLMVSADFWGTNHDRHDPHGTGRR